MVVTAPASVPFRMVSNVAKQIGKQADDELDQEAMLRVMRVPPESEKAASLVTADTR